MFTTDGSDSASKPAALAAPTGHEPAARPGLPIDPVRLARALRRAVPMLAIAAVIAAVIGGIVGKFVLKKTYLAAATVLWEPPVAAHADAVREITTLADSVKLPANILRLRALLKTTDTAETLAKNIDVAVGEASMLISIKAKATSKEESAAIANGMVVVFLEAQKDIAARRLLEIVSALRQSLSQSEAALVDARTKYDTFRREQHVADFSAEVQGAIAELARLRVAAGDARVELRSLEAREGALKKSRAGIPESVVVSRNEQSVDATRLAQLDSELAETRARYSEEHPAVRALKAEVDALRMRANLEPTITSRVVGRSPMRDTLSMQMEESAAVRSATSERSKSLDALQAEATHRAQQLTAVQGEAARLLADVQVNEEHVGGLLKQIAMAEDDVRSANSNFQIVSEATPPEHSEKGLGRIVAAATPFVTLLFGVVVVVSREVAGTKVKTAQEAAYWVNAPVLCATPWPLREGNDAARLSRACADAIEEGTGAIGITAVSGVSAARGLAELVQERLRIRGKTCTIVDTVRAHHERASTPTSAAQVSAAPDGAVPVGPFGDALDADDANASQDGTRGVEDAVGGDNATTPKLAFEVPDVTYADVLENHAFGATLREQGRSHRIVLVVLPSMEEREALRAVQRWLSGLIVVIPEGKATFRMLAHFRKQLRLDGRGIGVVFVADAHGDGLLGVGDIGRLWRPVNPPSEPPV